MRVLQWRIWQYYSQKKSMVKGPEYYEITVDCIFEDGQRVVSFFFFLGRWGFAFIGYFSAGNATKITAALNQRIWQTLWTSPQLPVTEPSMPAGAQSESRAQSPDASERQALWSDEPSFIPLTSYIGNRWGKSHCISQPPQPPDGEETSLLSFFTIFIWIPPPPAIHHKRCRVTFQGLLSPF